MSKENKEIEYYIMNSENITKTTLFRLKPFLLAYQKFLLYDDIIKVENEGGKILKLKIDGLYTDKMINEFEENSKKKKILEGEMVKDNFYKFIIFKNYK